MSIPTLNDNELIDHRIHVLDVIREKDLPIVGESIDDFDREEVDGNILKIQDIDILLDFDLMRPKGSLGGMRMLILINVDTGIEKMSRVTNVKNNLIKECPSRVNKQ